MAAAPAVPLVDALLESLALGPLDPAAGNRVAIEGLAVSRRAGGLLELRAASLEASSLRLASGPLTVDIGRVTLRDLVVQLRAEGGARVLAGLEAAAAECSGVRIQGPLDALPASNAQPGWVLGPLAGMDGTIRANIRDAHLLFDADVTVPVRRGEVDFNHATVEHVGPDSRMGVSRMGVYVEAPNGRSYLYQFPEAVVAGVTYERRGLLPGSWAADRGRLRLQAFAESMLGPHRVRRAMGLTEQARLLLERTTASGELQPGDGRLAVPGLQAQLAGRDEGRNRIRLHSEAVARGVTADIASLSLRDVVLGPPARPLQCESVEATLMLRLSVDGPQLRFLLDVPTMQLARLRLASTQR